MYKRIVSILLCCYVSNVVCGDAPNLSKVDYWWNTELPYEHLEDPDEATRHNIMVEFINRQKKVGFLEVSSAPNELLPAINYIARLHYFKNGGPPIGTPPDHLSQYFGFETVSTNIVYRLAQKSRSAPGFLGINVLRKVAVLKGQCANDALRTLAALNELDEITEKKWKKWLHPDPSDDADWDTKLTETRQKQATADSERLGYGITWGPVGPNATTIAIANILDMPVDDNRFEFCVELLSKKTDFAAVNPLLKFADKRKSLELSVNFVESSDFNMYPAIDLLYEMPERVQPQIEKDIFSLSGKVGASLPYNEITALKILSGISSPQKCYAWLSSLEEKLRRELANSSETAQIQDSRLSTVTRMKTSLRALKSIPRFASKQRFFGLIDWKN